MFFFFFFKQKTAYEISACLVGSEMCIRDRYADIQDAYIAIFPPPPVQGLGTIGGFRLQIEDRGNQGYEELFKQTQNIITKARALPELEPSSVFSSYQVNVPQIDADIDREKAKTHGVAISDIFDTLQVYLGSLYANDFNRFGRTYQVNVQAEQQFRLEPEQIGQLKVRNNLGEMVPLASFIKVSDTSGPDRVMHYNGFITAELNGAPAAGYSSGQAQAAIEKLLKEELPNGMTYELSLIHISEPTRQAEISYAVFCLKKKKNTKTKKKKKDKLSRQYYKTLQACLYYTSPTRRNQI